MAKKATKKPGSKKQRAKSVKPAIEAKQTPNIVTPEEPPKKTGRPTAYTEALGFAICQEIAEGRTLSSVCSDEAFPCARTVRRWALDPEHPFSPLYTRARELGFQSWADDIVDVSDNAKNDWMERFGKDGESLGWQANGDHISRSRLRVDSRKWLLSKMLPKVYGDKVALTDPDGGTLKVEFVR